MFSGSSMMSDLHTALMLSHVSKPHFHSFWTSTLNSAPFQCRRKLMIPRYSIQPNQVMHESEEKVNEIEQPKIKWGEVDAEEVTEDQKLAISQLPPKMTKRCKALMKRIICFPTEEGNLTLLLSSWAKTMKPIRADWLVILKEMKKMNSRLLLEVMEHALIEDSFEADIRDYTKLIDAYAKQNLVHDAENTFSAMKRRGFTCDQVTLTALVHMYSKAGDLNLAKETFNEIKLLGLPLDKRSYDSMIMAFIRAGIPESGESLLLEMESEEIYASREVYKALLRAYSSIGNADGAQRVFDAIQFAGIIPDVKLCALLLNAYCVAGHTDEARSVFENMRHAGLQPSDKCIALMLSAFEKENKLQKAMALLVELERDGVVSGKEANDVLVQWFHRLGLEKEVAQI